MTTTDHEQIHDAVKERYGAAAQAAQASCCGATSEAEAELFGAGLYDESETATLPDAAGASAARDSSSLSLPFRCLGSGP